MKNVWKLIRRIGVCSLVMLLLCACVACGGASTAPDDKETKEDGLSIVATIFPPYDFARVVGGDAVTVTQLLPPDTEAHGYEPTLGDLSLIESCDLFLYIGGETDAWVDELLATLDGKGPRCLALIDTVSVVTEETVAGMEGEEETAAETCPAYDEHIWTSPKNAKRMVQAITDVLCELDAANASVYTANNAAYQSDLDGLDEALSTLSANALRHTLIFAERFPFRYLAEDYGFTYYAAFPGCSSDTEPSLATIAFLVNKIEEEDIPAVFIIEFSKGSAAKSIQDATGCEILLLHSCHNLTRAEWDAGESYLSLMQANIENLRKALY